MELLLESGAGAPCPPRGRLQLLPSAQAWRAQPALPSGERQGDLVPAHPYFKILLKRAECLLGMKEGLESPMR